MGFFDKLLSWFRPKPPSHPEYAFEQLVWLEPNENPFGVKVLDCRPIAEGFLSATKIPEAIQFFGSPEAQSGELFRGQHPEDPIRVVCELIYPMEEMLPEGTLFLAEIMEEKWNIYHFDKALYFVRSWTGQLNYVAHIVPSPSELRVLEVEAFPGNVLGGEQLAVNQVDYLIKSHLFNQVAPHPVPGLPTKKGIALWSFSQYGRRGLFAVVDTGTNSQENLG